MKWVLAVFLLTYYDADFACTGKHPGHPAYGITASGTRAKPGTLACPQSLPFGTLVIIDGIWHTCLDRGGAIRGNRLDVYVESHAEARKRGIRRVNVEIVK